MGADIVSPAGRPLIGNNAVRPFAILIQGMTDGNGIGSLGFKMEGVASVLEMRQILRDIAEKGFAAIQPAQGGEGGNG